MSDDADPPDGVIDLEEYAKQGRPPPKDRRYRIRVDKEKFDVPAPLVTGRQILEIAGKTPPQKFRLSQKHHGGRVEPIDLDQVVDLTVPGVERFQTIPTTCTEGGAS